MYASKSIIATFFPTIFRQNLAKFQLSSMFLSQVLFENVFLRYRDFKFRDPFLAKMCPFLLNISENLKKIRYFGVLHDINYGDFPPYTDTLKYKYFELGIEF